MVSGPGQGGGFRAERPEGSLLSTRVYGKTNNNFTEVVARGVRWISWWGGDRMGSVRVGVGVVGGLGCVSVGGCGF